MARGTKGQQKSPRRRQAPPAPAAPPAPGALPGVAAGAGSAASTAAALASAFLTLTGMALLIACRKILLAFGVSLLIIAFLARYAFARLPEPGHPFEQGPAEEEQRRLAAAYRAWYIINAVERLEKAATESPDALTRAEAMESHYFRLHLRAVQNRIESARAVDDAARRWGDLLGWRAVMDQKTTLECRAANGKNFHASAEPSIGYPGAVHPHCRCIPTAPYPGAPVLP